MSREHRPRPHCLPGLPGRSRPGPFCSPLHPPGRPAGFILLSALFLLSLPARAAELPRSDHCGECHKTIYGMWRASAHAASLEDPVFLETFRATEAAEGKEVSRVCLQCHAPLAAVNEDWALNEKATWEGASCNVCHSIAAVDTSGAGARLVLVVSSVKQGPIPGAVSTGHDVSYSELFTTSLICAPCHEFVNAEGTPLMTTYTEWRASEAAQQGQTCQSCHMMRTEGDVVDPRVARAADARVNLHQVPGGHSLDQLNKALRISFQPERRGDSAVVEVDLINKGAGHAVPTGMPGRQVVLALDVQTSDGRKFEERRVYAKRFLDSTGARIERDSGYFARGVRLEEDSRIKAGEKRRERFAFPLPHGVRASLGLRLLYEHLPTGGDEGATRLTFYTERRFIDP